MFLDHGSRKELQLSKDSSLFYNEFAKTISKFLMKNTQKKLFLVLDSCYSGILFSKLYSLLTSQQMTNLSFMGHLNEGRAWKFNDPACPSIGGFTSLALFNAILNAKKNKINSFEFYMRKEAESIFHLVILFQLFLIFSY